MGTIFILLLLVVTKWCNGGHVIFGKEPTRYRLAYDDWKPVRETPVRHVRYPLYHKGSGYSYIPGKKISHQTVEQSEKVEIFSPAPPTILGSFSVFGHATVNAREHASHISKKSPRPQIADFAVSESRPKASSYQVRHQYHPSGYSNYHVGEPKRPQYNDYNDAYLYDSSLRPSLHDTSKSYHQSPQSSYYSHDQGQTFPPEKYRKPQKAPYRYSHQSYSTQLNEFKSTASPSDYDSTYSYYNGPSRNIDSEYYNENPVGAVPLSIRRPESSLKPVTEINNVHDHFSHIGRPFQSFTTVETIKGTIKPYATTYPSSSTVETRVKFSDVAHPFRISNIDHEQVSSLKPETSQQTFTEEIYPISVTTIDVPTEIETENIKESYNEFNSKRTPFKPSPYDHSHSNHRPYKNPYHEDEIGAPVFLPTPSTDISSYISEPKNEFTTLSPDSLHDLQDSNYIPSVENKIVEPSEAPTEVYSTLPAETTTKLKHHKSRRPSRPTTTPTSTPSYIDSELKYQRRRKPSNKYRTRGSTDKNTVYKRQRTTTSTTTVTPEGSEEEEVYLHTTVPSELIIIYDKDKYGYTGDKIEKQENKEYFDEKPYERTEEGKVNIIDAITTTTSSTTSTTTTTSPTTTPLIHTTALTPTTTDIASRLKSKYGNRPRFSIKDYRDKLNKATSTVSPHDTEKTKPPAKETELKFGGRTRNSTLRMTTATTSTTESPDYSKSTSEPKFQKYKPRLSASRYKTSTTQTPETDTTTTERSNTFKPSTNRYKPGTGKYYSRYRTPTVPPKEVEESPSTTTPKITLRPKGVFSAKRQPFPLKTKVEPPKIDTEESNEEHELGQFVESFKLNENDVFSPVLKKMDDSSTTTISSSEEDDQKKIVDKDPTGPESLRIADLTSSSSNDFHQSSYRLGSATSASKRPIPKITLPTDNPILPLEAFFQTQNN